MLFATTIVMIDELKSTRIVNKVCFNLFLVVCEIVCVMVMFMSYTCGGNVLVIFCRHMSFER